MSVVCRITFQNFPGLISEDPGDLSPVIRFCHIFIRKDRSLVGIEAEQQIHVVQILNARIRNEISVKQKAVKHRIRTHLPVGSVRTEKPRADNILRRHRT